MPSPVGGLDTPEQFFHDIRIARDASRLIQLSGRKAKPTRTSAQLDSERIAGDAVKMGMVASGTRTSSPDSHYYMVKREDGRTLWVTRDILFCLFDLTMHQAAKALGICSTTAKKMRAWSGVRRWPRNQVVCGEHSKCTLESVRSSREALMKTAMGDSDSCLCEVLALAASISSENSARRTLSGPKKKRRSCKGAVIMCSERQRDPGEPGEEALMSSERLHYSGEEVLMSSERLSYSGGEVLMSSERQHDPGEEAAITVAPLPLSPPATSEFNLDDIHFEPIDFYGDFDHQTVDAATTAAIARAWTGWLDPI